MRRIGIAMMIALGLTMVVGAQATLDSVTAETVREKPAVQPEQKAPVLSDVQKLQVQNAAQAIELWQLKAQQAASEFEKARTALQQLIAQVTPPGYQLTNALELQKVQPEPTKAEASKLQPADGSKTK